MENTSFPHMSPRAGYGYMLGFIAVMGACLAMPRLLSFLPALMGLAGVAYIKYTHKIFPAFDKTLALFFAGLVAWALISSLWAVNPDYSSARALKVAGILFPGILLLAAARAVSPSPLHKDRLPVIAACICAFAGFIIFFEFFTRFSITRAVIGMERGDMPENMRNGFVLNRSTVLLVVSVIPVTYMLWTSGLHKRAKFIWLSTMYATLAATLWVADSQTAQIAAAIAAAMVFFPSHRRKARMALLGLILVLMASAPFFVKPAYQALMPLLQASETNDLIGLNHWDKFLRRASVPHRLEVWNLAAEKIGERPLYGWGIDSMRFIKADYVMKNMGTDNVMHPHNAVLQIWLEFGAVGILFAMVFTAFLFRRIDALPAPQQRYYTLLFVVLLSILCTGYGLWQAWLLGMVINVTAMMIMAVRINSKT